MRRPKSIAKTLIFGFVVAAAHFAITFLSAAAMAISAVSGEPARFPLIVVERVFALCSFPLSLLPESLPPVFGISRLVLNSALCGFTLTAVVRRLWSLRKRPQ